MDSAYCNVHHIITVELRKNPLWEPVLLTGIMILYLIFPHPCEPNGKVTRLGGCFAFGKVRILPFDAQDESAQERVVVLRQQRQRRPVLRLQGVCATPAIFGALGDPKLTLCAALSAVSSRAKCRLCIRSMPSGRASGTHLRPPAESCRRSRAVRVWRVQRVTAKRRVLIAACVYVAVEISAAVASAEKSLKFLEQTIVMVEANRSKFDHIDNVGVSLPRSSGDST